MEEKVLAYIDTDAMYDANSVAKMASTAKSANVKGTKSEWTNALANESTTGFGVPNDHFTNVIASQIHTSKRYEDQPPEKR